MRSFYFKDGIQIVLAILLTGSMAYAMRPTTVETVKPESKVVTTKAIETKSTDKKAVKPQEKPAEAPKPEKAVTWRDNPQKCNQDTQFIAAEAPFDCIDKPTSRPVASATTRSAPASADDGSAKMFIYMRESGNNPGAINSSSGACGLGQALPCSKMGCSLSDYACQDRFFTGYMQSRYGTWENAKAFWLANHWW